MAKSVFTRNSDGVMAIIGYRKLEPQKFEIENLIDKNAKKSKHFARLQRPLGLTLCLVLPPGYLSIQRLHA